MGFYQNICYSVEDFFVKILSKKRDTDVVKRKVDKYRIEKESQRLRRKNTDKILNK